jgi:hypothetical protein
MGKKEASANAKKNRAIGPYGVAAQCSTQSYIFLMNSKKLPVNEEN